MGKDDPGKNNGSPASEALKKEITWHAASEDEIFGRLRASADGLMRKEAEQRLQEYGKNILPGKRPPGLVRVILHRLTSPLIYILLIASGVSLLIGDLKDAFFIMGVVLLNTAIGTVQEYRAEKSAHALQNLLRGLQR